MKPTLTVTAALLLILVPMTASAQIDAFGQSDTLYAELAQVDEQTWTITISVTNDEWLDALSLPFIMDAGETKIVGDSAVYTGGRVEDFDFKGFRADTAVQCVTMGLMANMSPGQNGLPPGSGRLVTVFVSTIDDEPLPHLSIDSTTTEPTNSLMFVAQKVQPGEPPDTIPDERFDDLRIIPALVIERAE
jgi:hypothetical protein